MAEGDHGANLFQLEEYANSHFKRAKKSALSNKKVPVRAMLQWQKGPLKASLISGGPKDAPKLFTMIQNYMGDMKHKEKDEIAFAVKLIERAITDVLSRDELYCELIKQVTFNPSQESTYKGWTLLSFFVQYFPPNAELFTPVMKFLEQHLKVDVSEKLPEFAKFCMRLLPKTNELGARGRVPDMAELRGLEAKSDTNGQDAPFKAAVFGVQLVDVMEAQKELSSGASLPLILTTLCSKITELQGHRTEGIFRVPGDVGQMTNLRIQIESGNYSCEGLDDPHVPGSLLKLWMRELESPIVPTEKYDAAIDAAKKDEPLLSVAIANDLPELNRRVAYYMIDYLRKLAVPENVPFTRMGVPNLAMVFAPNFLRCPSEDPSVIFNTQKHQQTFVRHLIEEWISLAGDESSDSKISSSPASDSATSSPSVSTKRSKSRDKKSSDDKSKSKRKTLSKDREKSRSSTGGRQSTSESEQLQTPHTPSAQNQSTGGDEVDPEGSTEPSEVLSNSSATIDANNEKNEESDEKAAQDDDLDSPGETGLDQDDNDATDTDRDASQNGDEDGDHSVENENHISPSRSESTNNDLANGDDLDGVEAVEQSRPVEVEKDEEKLDSSRKIKRDKSSVKSPRKSKNE